MPIATKSAYGLTWEQVNFFFPFNHLTGADGVIGPSGGIVVIAGIDEAQPPINPADHIVQLFASTGSGSGSATATVTRSADADGNLTYMDAGIEKSFWEGGVRIACTTADLATYFIVLMTGNNIPPPDPAFIGVPPPPRKPSKPTVTNPDPDDEWGSVTVSWTTPDIIDTEVMGFIVRTISNIPGAVAYIAGIVPVDPLRHPNYFLNYAIGANEYPDPTTSYTFTVEPYLFGSPDNTLGVISDASDPVIFDSNDPEIPVVPDIEIPPLEDPEDPDSEPIPGVPVTPEEINPETGLPYPPGTLKGAGYGGFNLGGSSLDDAVFMMNVSGIYTLVEGKTHDTLYERMTGITFQNVKIPDPFAKTGFL